MSDPHRTIRRASYLMMASILLSRVIGFAREWVLAHSVGASAMTDVYYASFTIPDFLNHLMAAGALSISFVPMLTGYLAENRTESAHRIFRFLSTIMGALLVLLIVLGEIFALPLARLVAPGFSEDQYELLATLLRIILPAQFFFYWGGLAIAVQYAHGRFFLPAVAPLVYNLGIIGFGLVLHQRLGVMGFSIGVLAGCFASHGVLQWMGVRKLGYPTAPLFRFTEECVTALKRYLWLTAPIMLGFSLVIADEWIAKYFGSTLGDRAISWLSYARTEMRIPVAVIGQAAGIASFPYLARLWSEKRYDEYAGTLLTEIKKLWALAPLASLFFYDHALPITHFIFGGSRLTTEDLEATAQCLRLFSLGIPFWTLQLLLSRGFYASQRTWLPSLVGTVASFLIIPLYPLFERRLGVSGLAAAGSLGIALYTAWLWWLLRRHIRAAHPSLSLGPFYRFAALWCVVLVAAYGISRGVWELGIYRGTQLSALLDVTAATAAIGLFAIGLLRTLFKPLTGGKPLF